MLGEFGQALPGVWQSILWAFHTFPGWANSLPIVWTVFWARLAYNVISSRVSQLMPTKLMLNTNFIAFLSIHHLLMLWIVKVMANLKVNNFFFSTSIYFCMEQLLVVVFHYLSTEYVWLMSKKNAYHVRLKDDTQCIFSWKCQVYVGNSLFSWQAKGCSFGKETV